MTTSATTPMTLLTHPAFPEADQMLRRGAHIGSEDHILYDFVVSAESTLIEFYLLYDAHLARTPEGVYFLEVGENPLFSTRVLSRLDMVVGKTMATMLMTPETVTSLGRVPLVRLLTMLDLSPGRAVLMAFANIKSADEEVANRKLRDDIRKSLNTLGRLNVVHWSPREDEIIPYKALMRFADDVRTDGDVADNLAAHVAAGSAVLDVGLSPSMNEDDDDDA